MDLIHLKYFTDQEVLSTALTSAVQNPGFQIGIFRSTAERVKSSLRILEDLLHERRLDGRLGKADRCLTLANGARLIVLTSEPERIVGYELAEAFVEGWDAHLLARVQGRCRQQRTDGHPNAVFMF